jgi:ABC-type branched-subunit amino acid transport system ATPase component
MNRRGDGRLRTWLPLVAVMGFSAIVQVNGLALVLLLPDIKDGYHLGLALVTFILAVRIQIGLATDVPVSVVTNRGWRMHLTCAGMAAFVACSVLAAIAGMIGGVILLDVAVLGVAAASGAFTSTQNSLLADYYPADIRARVYYAQRAAIVFGLSVTPLLVAWLKLYYSWPTIVWVLAAPMAVFIVIGLVVGEPASTEESGSDAGDEPPTLPETARVVFANRSARRIYYSLPLFAAAVIGIEQFANLFYENVFHQDASQRHTILGAVEPFALVGLLVGMVVVQRLMVRTAARAVRAIALGATLAGVCLAVLAVSPDLGWAVGAHIAYVLASSWLVAGVYTVISVLLPSRMLTLGFALSTVWFQFGIWVVAPAGLSVAVAVDGRWGFRAGMVVFAVLYVAGSLVLRSAAGSLDEDLTRTAVSALADEEGRQARLEGRTKLLMVRALDAGYDGFQVLSGVDLDVDEGEIVALLGTNGAGKTTLLRAISGLTVPTAGEVLLDGRAITTWDPNRIVDHGIVQIPGGRGVFPTLTVAESLRVASWRYGGDAAAADAAVEEVLAYFPTLAQRWDVHAGSLSGGEQQMLSLAQAFLARPRLLMIDELALGLAPIVVESLLEIVRTIHDRGTAVLLVEQSVNLALRLADRAVFMERGRIVDSRPVAELSDRDQLVRAVFLDGAADSLPAATPSRATGPAPRAARPSPADGGGTPQIVPVLAGTQLVKRFGGVVAVNRVDVELFDGEILGLIGPNGAGKTTVFELLSGHLALDGGRVRLFGEDVSDWPAQRRAAAGLARSFQSARLWPGLTVQESVNLAVSKCEPSPGVLASLLSLPRVSRAERRIASIADGIVDSLGLGPYRDQLTSDLSTGTRRLVELAVMVALRPRVLLLDEPSAGISAAETDSLVPLLLATKERLGCSVMLIEHDITLMRRVADRIAALDAGEVIAVGPADEVLHHPRVIESYLGATTH